MTSNPVSNAPTPESAGDQPQQPRSDVNGVKQGVLWGWAWDPIHPDTRQQLIIEHSLGDSVRVTADQFRQDLLEHKVGDGHHGFTFPLPSSWLTRDGTIQLRFQSSGLPLKRGTLQVCGGRIEQDAEHASHNPADKQHRKAAEKSAALVDACRKIAKLSQAAGRGYARAACRDLSTICLMRGGLTVRKLAAFQQLCLIMRDSGIAPANKIPVHLSEIAEQAFRDTPYWRNSLVHAELLAQSGAVAKAYSLVLGLLSQGRRRTDTYLAAANLTGMGVLGDFAEIDDDLMRERARFDWINAALASNGYNPIEKIEASLKLSLDNITGGATSPQDPVPDQPLISVIIPCFNAEAFLATSIESILKQTEKRMEILLVDDASTDGTREIIAACESRDPRARAIYLDTNRGVYNARNTALAVARGEFVTVQDADDWAHPQRIESHLRQMEQNPGIIASVSQWARCSDNLHFHRRPYSGRFLHMNSASIFFRREPCLEKIGYWDCVRFGADTEYWHRIRTCFGDDAVVEMQGHLLAFGRQRDNSLSQAQATAYHGGKTGCRRAYMHGYLNWHAKISAGQANPRMDFPLPKRPFAIHPRMAPHRPSTDAEFDVVMVSDFRHMGGNTASNLQEIQAQFKAGLRTGLMQVDRYDFPADRPIHPQIQECLDRGMAEWVCHGDTVNTGLAILRFPAIFNEWCAFYPEIHARHLAVIINQPPRRTVGEKPFYCVRRCQHHIEKLFKQPGQWYPIGPAARQSMVEDGFADLLESVDWVNIIDLDPYRNERTGFLTDKPVIGRHSRDDYTKWSPSAAELLQAYPDDPAFKVRILGGADTPAKTLGTLPDNWEVLPFNSVPAEQFLHDIDFFVFFPHPQRIEAFGRNIIEAMAARCLVILPQMFEPLFGDMALYCEPSGVQEIILKYWHDQDAYLKRVESVHAELTRRFSHNTHLRRIAPLVGIKPGTPAAGQSDT